MIPTEPSYGSAAPYHGLGSKVFSIPAELSMNPS